MRFRSKVPSTAYTGLVLATIAFPVLYFFRSAEHHQTYWEIATAIALLLCVVLAARSLLTIFVNYTDLRPQGLLIHVNWSKRLVPYNEIRSVRIHLDEDTGKPWLNQVELKCNDSAHFPKIYGAAPKELDAFLKALRPHIPHATFDI